MGYEVKSKFVTDPQNSVNCACLEKQRENTSRKRAFIRVPEMTFDLVSAPPKKTTGKIPGERPID